MCIITIGVLSIQAGDFPELQALKMATPLSDTGIKLSNNFLYRMRYHYDLDELKNLDGSLTTQILMHFNGMEDASIQRFIETIDIDVFSIGIIPLYGDVLFRLYKNYVAIQPDSDRGFQKIEESYITSHMILESQKEMLRIIEAGYSR
ncbi:MAG: hypothetical protein EH225_05320 [Calditrichaeota bacterium]|nr:MAG: hypothetical protein EH225_05320 [Calditrichota bacterium]